MPQNQTLRAHCVGAAIVHSCTRPTPRVPFSRRLTRERRTFSRVRGSEMRPRFLLRVVSAFRFGRPAVDQLACRTKSDLLMRKLARYSSTFERRVQERFDRLGKPM